MLRRLVLCAAALLACAPNKHTCDASTCVASDACIAGWDTWDEAIAADPADESTACRLPCGAPEDCPFGFHCVGYCVADRKAYVPAHAGESAGDLPWGAPCSPFDAADPDDPTAPMTNNADCDASQGFWCYAASPTDANGFCTQFQCTDDGDCAAGYWCATVDDTPNAITATRKDWGTTATVCLPRAYEPLPGRYCAPCTSDGDCPRAGGVRQHCVSANGEDSEEKVCAAECQDDGSCPLDELCTANEDDDATVCLPRARTCRGDGSFCSPCHSDADCGNGLCLEADSSTEHFCSVQTNGCNPNGVNCPVLPAAAHSPLTTTDSVECVPPMAESLPQAQCTGYNQTFGAGCYTYHCAGVSVSCTDDHDCCTGLTCDVNHECSM